MAVIEAAFAHHGLRWRYVNMEVAPDDLGDAVRGARALGFRGFNLSIPHKVVVIEHLDGLGPSAHVIGAVNCVVRAGGELIGENTDGAGFLASLRQVVDPAGQRVVLLGTGGAARAIAVELALAGACHLTVVNRSPARGTELVALLEDRCAVGATFVPWQGSYAVDEEADVVVNTTSGGHVRARRGTGCRRSVATTWSRGRRCRFQPRQDPTATRGSDAWVHDPRRSWDARAPSRRGGAHVDRLPPRLRGDALGVGGADVAGVVDPDRFPSSCHSAKVSPGSQELPEKAREALHSCSPPPALAAPDVA